MDMQDIKSITIGRLNQLDYSVWQELWGKYLKFYGYELFPDEVTKLTWQRFFDVNEPVYALAARDGDRIVGIVHYLLHHNTWQVEFDCYLQDLYVDETMRGGGVARRLIEAVYTDARLLGAKTVYWQTHQDNITARKLYDKIAKYSGFIVYSKEVGTFKQ